jgi:hypothetical protein
MSQPCDWVSVSCLDTTSGSRDVRLLYSHYFGLRLMTNLPSNFTVPNITSDLRTCGRIRFLYRFCNLLSLFFFDPFVLICRLFSKITADLNLTPPPVTCPGTHS